MKVCYNYIMKNEQLKKFLSSKVSKSLAVFLAVLLIGAAVYVNYKLFYDPVDGMGYGEGNMQGNTDGSATTGGNADDESYFTATALNRQQSRRGYRRVEACMRERGGE
jgi:hypothetical protein